MSPEATRVRIAIVGTGFAGLGMAIRLKQAGLEDFLLLERADDVGGTWRDNTYPGAACDIPSHLYSFSFALNPAWSRSFSPQSEIQGYLRACAERYGIRPHIRFRHEVLSATWDEGEQHWQIETTGSEFFADVLISAAGALSDPSIPALPGLERFEGTTFHSATWDHGHDLGGERVAVVGTGASAIQFVPQIQPNVERLVLFQRTPPWIIPRVDRRLTRVERWLFRRAPLVQRMARTAIYWAHETYVFGFAINPRLMKVAERVARLQLAAQVPDPKLRARVTPSYTIGCKRILISNDYLPALSKPNVDVVTSGIAEVRERSIVTTDGAEHPVDTIIFGTGFRVTDIPVAARIHGRGGVSLKEQWRPGMQAYRGTAVTGFPNLFLLVGPNTGLGHNSQVFMIEAQIAYLMDALRQVAQRGATAVEVRPEAQAAYNERLEADMEGTVWTSGGCGSWYLDEHGRDTTLWPSFTWRFWRQTRRFDPAAYVFERAHRETGKPRERADTAV